MRHPLFIAAVKNAFDEEREYQEDTIENKIEYFFYSRYPLNAIPIECDTH